MQEEHVVLVNEANEVLGTAPKATVHQAETPLHRAFSFFLLDGQGRLLIQQRALSKKTWPGVWSNSCCGHPALGESTEAAVRRRLKHELGVEVEAMQEMLPDYRYCAVREGVMENECCPVWAAQVDAVDVQPNPEEVEAVDWTDWADFIAALKDPQDTRYDHFSVWSKEEALLLDALPEFNLLVSFRSE